MPSLAQSRKELSFRFSPTLEAGRSALEELYIHAGVKALLIGDSLKHIDIRVAKSVARIDRKVALILATTALLIAGCGSQITAADIAKYQGSFRDASSEGNTNGEYADQFYYESAIPRMKADAATNNIPIEDVNLALSTPRETRISIGSATTCRTARVEKTAVDGIDGTPATLYVNESEDGTCYVEVRAQECQVGTDTCTMPATFSVNVTTDRTGPAISFGQPSLSPDGTGLLVSASASDRSGVASLTVQVDGQTLTDQNPDPAVFTAIVNPRLGTVRFTAVAGDNMDSTTAQDQMVDYGITTTTTHEVVNNTLTIHGVGSSSLGNPITVSVSQCDGQALNAPGKNTAGSGTVTVDGVIPKPGVNCFQTTATDGFGNSKSDFSTDPNLNRADSFSYDLSANNPSGGQVDHKLVIEGDTSSNLSPAINIVIKQCGTGIDLGTFPVDTSTGHFVGTVAPTGVGDNCIQEFPMDGFGQLGAPAEFHTNYTFLPPRVDFQLDPKDPTKLIVFVDTEDMHDPSTFTAKGEQPMWKQMGATGTFSCNDLQIGNVTDFKNQNWDLRVSCTLPSGDVGDPTIFFDIKDQNGFSLSGSLPMNAKTVFDVRDNPNLFESAVFWGGIMTLVMAGLAGTGALGAFMVASHDNLLTRLQIDTAKNELSTLLAKQGHRTEQEYRDLEMIIVAAEKTVTETTSGLRGVLKGKNKQEYIEAKRRELDTYRIIATTERINESIGKIHIPEHLIHPQFLPDIVDAVMHLNQLYQTRAGEIDADVRDKQIKALKSKIKEWIFIYTQDGAKRNDLSKMISNNSKHLGGNILKLFYDIQVQKKGNFHHLWQELVRDDPKLAEELQDLAICYAASTSETVDHGVSRPAIAIEANTKRLFSSVRHRTITEQQIIYILRSRGLLSQVEGVLSTTKAPTQKVMAAFGLLQAGDVERAVSLIEGLPAKTQGLIKVQEAVTHVFTDQLQKAIYSRLPLNRKFNIDLITQMVRESFISSGKLPQFGPYIEMISHEVQKRNMLEK